MHELKPLLHARPRTYARRWWVLVYVSLAYIFITLGWNTWGPISQSAEYAFGWNDSTIADILNVGRIGVFCCIVPMCYLVDTKGIRHSMVTSTSLTLVGYGMRCFIDQTTSTWPALLGQMFIGSGMGITFGGPVAMSVAWFPKNERALATSVAVMSTYLGYGIAYVLHPLFVSTPVFGEEILSHQIQNELANYTDHDLSLAANSTNVSMVNVVMNKGRIKEDTMLLIYIETGIALAFVIVGVALLPHAPPTPPSNSANAARMGYTKVIVYLVRSGFLCLILIYTGALVGMYSTWISIFEIAFGHLGVTQQETGWLGFASLIASSFIGCICARFSDLCSRKSKTILMTMLIISSLMFLWVSLLCSQYIEYSREQLYASTIFGCAFLNGCIPLLYEQICNAAFPIPEGIIVGISALLTTIVGILYILPLSLIHFEDNSWLEWAMLVVCVIGCVVISLTPQRNGRADLDMSIHVAKTANFKRLGADPDELHVTKNKVPENA